VDFYVFYLVRILVFRDSAAVFKNFFRWFYVFWYILSAAWISVFSQYIPLIQGGSVFFLQFPLLPRGYWNGCLVKSCVEYASVKLFPPPWFRFHRLFTLEITKTTYTKKSVEWSCCTIFNKSKEDTSYIGSALVIIRWEFVFYPLTNKELLSVSYLWSPLLSDACWPSESIR
jgi:hypothetical protein